MKNIIITESQLEHIKDNMINEDSFVKDRVDKLKDNMSLLKKNLRKIYNGDNYIEASDYMINGKLVPEKYTPEMKEKFLKKCHPSKDCHCMNSTWDRCFLKCESCFEEVFNKMPGGVFAKTLHYMQENGWKDNNTVERLKQIIKEENF